jgi:hypothetical protein
MGLLDPWANENVHRQEPKSCKKNEHYHPHINIHQIFQA